VCAPDRGVAKSQLLKHVAKVAPRAVYTTRQGQQWGGPDSSRRAEPGGGGKGLGVCGTAAGQHVCGWMNGACHAAALTGSWAAPGAEGSWSQGRAALQTALGGASERQPLLPEPLSSGCCWSVALMVGVCGTGLSVADCLTVFIHLARAGNPAASAAAGGAAAASAAMRPG